MFVLATDPDRGNNGSVVYDIIKNSVTVGSKQDYFVIDRQSGLIKTNVDPRDLDRETIPSFTLEVRASDEGKPSLNATATITISLNDINDQKPVFDPKTYRTEMSENQKSGEVFRVGATDADMGNNAQLTYRLADRDSKFFQVITIDNMGSILVYGVSLDFGFIFTYLFQLPNLSLHVKCIHERLIGAHVCVSVCVCALHVLCVCVWSSLVNSHVSRMLFLLSFITLHA